jgi:hypothetical protein
MFSERFILKKWERKAGDYFSFPWMRTQTQAVDNPGCD